MSKLYYICKYTPIELLESMGAECILLDGMVNSFSEAERAGHPNLCGYGKAIIEKVISENIKELVLVNCCDTIRSVYDILLSRGSLDFLYFMDLAHDESTCGADRMAFELKKLYKAYKGYSGNDIRPEAFEKAFDKGAQDNADYIGILGARVNNALCKMISDSLPLPVHNLTCVSGRDVKRPEFKSVPRIDQEKSNANPDQSTVNPDQSNANPDQSNTNPDQSTANPDFPGKDFFRSYAKELINQTPCMRMNDITARKALYNDPHLKAIVYHTVKFCDYYGFEYSDLKKHCDVPILKMETDYTLQSAGQLVTRLEAFAEQLEAIEHRNRRRNNSNNNSNSNSNSEYQFGNHTGNAVSEENKDMSSTYYAGIDSGSTSTKAAIIDGNGKIVSTALVPTGAKVALSSNEAFEAALSSASLTKEDIASTVTTGYGRKAVGVGSEGSRTVTEISCHAKGAHALDNSIRTIIDIGGQDSKVICVDGNGNVASFAMNDKCAAGTGRFLEMTGRTLGLSLKELSERGIKWKEDIAISNTCTVFAESEIISLVADDKSLDDIVHGLNRSVAVKVSSLMKRTGATPNFMMTGGVAANRSVVKAIEELLGAEVRTSPYAQFCGAYGAALFAREYDL